MTPDPKAIERWAASQPSKLVFLDVETTGLSHEDKIVSIGIVALETAGLIQEQFRLQVVNLIFDPGKRSHPMAEAAHGYDDWTLRHQEPFESYATKISELVKSADAIVAHNCEFDYRMLAGSLTACGHSIGTARRICTQKLSRPAGRKYGPSFDLALRAMGASRRSDTHAALEDAWLTMNLYLFMTGCPTQPLSFAHAGSGEPTNWASVPPRPAGPLPRRKKRRSA